MVSDYIRHVKLDIISALLASTRGETKGTWTIKTPKTISIRGDES